MKLVLEIPTQSRFWTWYYIQSACIALALFVLGVAFVVLSFATLADYGTFLGIAGVVFIITSIVLGFRWTIAAPLAPIAVWHPYIWLVGASPDYLEKLPEIPSHFPSRMKSIFHIFR